MLLSGRGLLPGPKRLAFVNISCPALLHIPLGRLLVLMTGYSVVRSV